MMFAKPKYFLKLPFVNLRLLRTRHAQDFEIGLFFILFYDYSNTILGFSFSILECPQPPDKG